MEIARTKRSLSNEQIACDQRFQVKTSRNRVSGGSYRKRRIDGVELRRLDDSLACVRE
jgi:hypothetical protein